MRVSVVICTFNRADGLRETLRCLEHQAYSDFEVLVVNGPSTDGTEDVLRHFESSICVRRCEAANLSKSRNIGLRAASGDIVAFIDDDALPEFCWLSQAVPAFDHADVAGVGGIVIDHTGVELQYKYSASNRFAEPTSSMTQPYDAYATPGSFTFPYLQGTNALFRRELLLRIGGFDETFDYYLDETDLCCRIVDAGYRLKQLDRAAVHHKFLPSGIRNHQRVVTNWFPIVKNHVYFSFRHALPTRTESEVLEHSRRFVEHVAADAQIHETAGRLAPGSAATARDTVERALMAGAELGRAAQHVVLPPLVSENRPFYRYRTMASDRPLRVAIVSHTSELTSEVNCFLGQLAAGLADMGHDVRHLRPGDGVTTVDLEDGLWVHRVAVAKAEGNDGGSHDDLCAAYALELERVGDMTPIDIVYGSLHDSQNTVPYRLQR